MCVIIVVLCLKTDLSDAAHQPTHLQYIIAAANLHAFNYGLRGETDATLFKKVAESVLVPEFTPRSGVKVQITETDPVEGCNGTSMSYIFISTAIFTV